MTSPIPPYFPPFLWKFWLSDVGPNRKDCQRLHIYNVYNGEFSETKRVPEQPRDIFHDLDIFASGDAGDCDRHTNYLEALRDAQEAFWTLENEAETTLTEILENLRSNPNTAITLHRRKMMVLRKFFVFLWYRNSKHYLVTLAECSPMNNHFHMDWMKGLESTPPPECVNRSGSFSVFQKKMILRSFQRFLRLDHLLVNHPATTSIADVDEGFIQLCRPDVTELVISVAPGKQEYIVSDGCFGVLDEATSSKFGDMFFPLTPTVALYLIERPNGLESIADDKIQSYTENEEDVDMRNTIIFRANPCFLYFCSLPSIVTSITTSENNRRTPDSDPLDYSGLRARCRQKTLQESVTKTLVLKGSITVTDLTDEITLVGESPIAFGGFADIWKGVWTQAGGGDVSVALKVLRRVMFPDIKDKLVKRLKDEVLAWHRLQHPHIASLYGIVQLPMTLGMASPWCDNGTVVRYLKEVAPDADRISLLSQVASGVAYLHNFKPTVIHGDLKGGNILIDNDGQAKITDFGLSKVIEDFSDTLHMHIPTSFFAGSTRWMAPELVLALVNDDCGGGDDDGTGTTGGTPPPITTFSDVYAFGAVGLEILTGQLPFPLRTNDHAVTIDIMRGIKPSRGTSKSKVVSSCNLDDTELEGLWDMLESCWSPDCYARPSMSLVVRYLDKLVATSRLRM